MFDAGDLFHARYRVTADQGDELRATAKLIVEQFNRIGCDGLVLGDRDLALGPELLGRLHQQAKFPFLVANLVNRETGAPFFEDHTVIEVAGVKVGVFGVTLAARRTASGGGEPPWRIEDPFATAKREVKALGEAGAQVIVALSHLTEKEQSKLAREVPGITAVFGGQSIRSNQHPETIAGAYVVDGSTKGKHLSILTLHIQRGMSASGPFVDRYKKKGLELRISQLASRIASYERLVQRKEKEAKEKTARDGARTKAGGKPSPRRVGVEQYRKQLVNLQAQRQALAMELDDTKEVDPTANFLSYELFPVDIDIPDEPVIGKAVTAHRKRYPKAKPGTRKTTATPGGKATRKAIRKLGTKRTR